MRRPDGRTNYVVELEREEPVVGLSGAEFYPVNTRYRRLNVEVAEGEGAAEARARAEEELEAYRAVSARSARPKPNLRTVRTEEEEE